MKKLVPANTVTDVTDFPYAVGKPWMYGCNPSDPTCRELLDSLLYAVENPDTPDGMTYVYDIVGLTEWYDQDVPADEKEEYDWRNNCLDSLPKLKNAIDTCNENLESNYSRVLKK